MLVSFTHWIHNNFYIKIIFKIDQKKKPVLKTKILLTKNRNIRRKEII